jgi:signal transduction histidine kinase
MKKSQPKSTSEALQYSLRQQELVSEIALEMNSLKSFPKQINRTLRKIGKHTGVSRVYIFEDSPDGTTSSNTFEWCNKGIEPQINVLQDFPYAIIPSWKKYLINEGLVYSEDVNRLPADLQAALEPQEVLSIIAYPLYVQQRFFGFIGFDECVRKKRWSRTELELLRTLSGIVANAFERKQMEAALRCERDKANEANRAKNLFLASISHEIRSPMNTVLGFSEALLHELPDEEQRKMAQSIITSGNLLLSLLNDILDLSKIEAGRMEIVPGPVQLKQLLEEIGTVFGLQADQKGIALQVSVNEALPEVLLVDEVRIKQVAFNLLGNAIRFTKKGEVHMTVNYTTPQPRRGDMSVAGMSTSNPQPRRGDMSVAGMSTSNPQPRRGDMSVHPATLIIEVSDTGIGIPLEEQNRIFEPFIQAPGVAGNGYGGTGLGLSICKRLVEQMHGTLVVQSRLGKGSVFTATIPCSEP